MQAQRSKYSSRLSPVEVDEIRTAPFALRHTDLATRYGVTASTIARIRHGLTWQKPDHEVLRVRLPTAVCDALALEAKHRHDAPEAVAVAVLSAWALDRASTPLPTIP